MSTPTIEEPVVHESPASPPVTRPSGINFESLAVAGFIFGLFAIVAAMIAVGLAARAVDEASGGGAAGGAVAASGPAPKTLEVSATEFAFDPADAEIAAGGTITLHNDGTMAHDLVIEGVGTELVEAGATGEVKVEGIDPGEYQYYCSVPGHREAGMEGRILVS